MSTPRKIEGRCTRLDIHRLFSDAVGGPYEFVSSNEKLQKTAAADINIWNIYERIVLCTSACAIQNFFREHA